ncbi:hypothetical protein [Lysinibacillus fusiformis]|uniref:hypothetical protein n=1 Tax=Lysinibacillus fusiformis TaxID=28031 RepID=UPI0021BFE729|nr:hypothetical protein [Lysinibacillus fusiformis]UXJ71278.1 hypothetical protein N5069_23875 [Lysinibacillus fusiformis]
MKIRFATKKLIIAASLGAAVMLLISGVGFYFLYKSNVQKQEELRQNYKDKLAELEYTTEQSELAYTLNTDVDRGQLIHKSMVQQSLVPKNAVPADALIDVQFDGTKYYAKANYKMNQPVAESLFYIGENLTKDIRSVEYAAIELPSRIQKDEYVDVRIQFPTGEDFIVFSKKKVVDTQGLTLWLENDEGEIQSMSSAMVDAYLNAGKLYALRYVDGETQEKAEITYPVNKAVLERIKVDPNIVDIAKLNLEKQNREALELNLQALDKAKAEELRSKESQQKSLKEQEDKERLLNSVNEDANAELDPSGVINEEYGE